MPEYLLDKIFIYCESSFSKGSIKQTDYKQDFGFEVGALQYQQSHILNQFTC